jgi:hypothetical protein
LFDPVEEPLGPVATEADIDLPTIPDESVENDPLWT